MKILILEGLHGNNKGKKIQWRLKRTNLKVGNGVTLNCHDWKVIKVVKEKKRSVFPKGAVFSEFVIGSLPTSEEINALLESLRQTPGTTVEFSSAPTGKNPATKFIEQEKERISLVEACRLRIKAKKEKQALSELRNRPYFKTIITEVKGKPSRGENLEKIKFPCFCSYKKGFTNKQLRYGILTRGFTNKLDEYLLNDITNQCACCSVEARSNSLKEIIRYWNIKILKGEMRLWREVER